MLDSTTQTRLHQIDTALAALRTPEFPHRESLLAAWPIEPWMPDRPDEIRARPTAPSADRQIHDQYLRSLNARAALGPCSAPHPYRVMAVLTSTDGTQAIIAVPLGGLGTTHLLAELPPNHPSVVAGPDPDPAPLPDFALNCILHPTPHL